MYDNKCWKLAGHFLEDYPSLSTKGNRKKLAQTIQDAIEDWMEENLENPKRGRSREMELYCVLVNDRLRS